MFQHLSKRIGEILLDARLITEEQLHKALSRQHENGRSLGINLVDLGYIREEDITRCIAEQYTIPYVSLDRYIPRKDLLHVVPGHVSRTHSLIPLDLVGDILTVGIVDAPDKEIIKLLEKLTGFRIQMMLINPSDFNEYMQNMEDAYDLPVVDTNKGFGGGKPGERIETPSYSGQERRRYPRFDKGVKVKYEIKNEYNINPSINISRGGVLVKSKLPVPVNSYLMVRMEIPTSHEDIIIISRVARVERANGTYHIALNFSGMDIRDSKKLSEFLKAKQ